MDTTLQRCVNHHLFRYIKRTDQGLFLLNTHFLLCVGLIPFVTALAARYLHLPGEHIAAIVYSGTLLLMSLTFSGLWGYAKAHPHLLDPRIDPSIVRHLFRRSFMSIPFYLLSVFLSLVSVEASLVLYILIAMFYALPIDRFLNRVQMREERTSPPRTRTSDIQ